MKISYEDVHSIVKKIADTIHKDSFNFDVIIGLTRGGLIPAVIMSHMTNVKMIPLHVSLRDFKEDTCITEIREKLRSLKSKKILIIDDINDSGKTFEWIKENIEACLSDCEIKYAAVLSKKTSVFKIDYAGKELFSDDWINFPWENS